MIERVIQGKHTLYNIVKGTSLCIFLYGKEIKRGQTFKYIGYIIYDKAKIKTIFQE